MSFATDVLVVALDDRGRLRANGDIATALGGALLIEDLLAGRSLRDLTGLDQPADAVGSRGRGAVAIVRSQAVGQGLVRRSEDRVLGIIPRRRYLLADHGARDRLVEALRSATSPGARPESRFAAFALVCAVSGITRRWVPAPGTPAERAAVAGQINELCALAGESVTEVVRGIRTQYGRRDDTGGDTGVFVLLATNGSDDYGDTGSAGDGGGGGSDGGGGGGGGGGGD